MRVGVLHADNATDERGGFSVFVPEDYDPARAYPLVMALHGGSGHGRLFLWSWVREARSRGVIVVAPTADRRHLVADGARRGRGASEARAGARGARHGTWTARGCC